MPANVSPASSHPACPHRKSRASYLRCRVFGSSAASLLSLLAIPESAFAAIAGAPATFWLGGTDGTWTGNNWASNAASTSTTAIPTAVDNVTFSATGAAHQNTTLGADFTIRSLTISDPAAVTINSGAAPHTLTLSGSTGSGLNVQSGAGLVTIGANIALGGLSDTITVNNTSGAVINGALGGSHGLIKQGTGTLTLAGLGTYTGGTAVNAGTLAVYRDGSRVGTLGSGVATVNGGSVSGGAGGTLKFLQQASTGNAIITAKGGTASGAGGGITEFNDTSRADGATLIANGGTSGGAGGAIIFRDRSQSDGATLIANGGTSGGAGGAIIFREQSNAYGATLKVFDNGRLDISGHSWAGFFSGSIEGDGNIFLGGIDMTLTGIVGTKTFSGVIRDGGISSGTGGHLAMLSERGTLNLTGANTYTGGTLLLGGTLAAGNAKAFGSGDLTLRGGTLRSTGGPQAVDIGGGNIHFSGPVFSVVDGGKYLATVGGTTPGVTHDQLKTTGTANITEGILILVPLNNYHLAPGDKVVLIFALGGVAGGTADGTAMLAANVTGLDAFGSLLLVPVVNLYTTSVTLEALQGSFAALAGTLGFTPNQLAVAVALDSVAQIGSKTGVLKEFDYLDSLPSSLIAANLDLLSPASLTSIFTLSTSLANIQTANIQQRLADIRTTEAAGIAAAEGTSGGGTQGPKGARGKSIAPADDERWGLWFTGSGEFTRVGSTTNVAGFSLDSGGVTGGVDYRFTEHFAAGISLGYMNTTTSIASGGRVNVDGGRVGAYATWFDRGLHFDAAVSGGPNSYATHRTMPDNTTATGSPEGTEVNLLFATGYDWKFKGLTVGPVASFQYTNVQLNGFTESGTFAPLSVAAQNAESLRTALGFHAMFDAKVGGTIIRPEVRAAWQRESGDTSYSLTSRFATLGGSAFTVSGPATGRDSLLVGAGLSIRWNERFATYAYYDAELLRANYSSNNVSVGFRYQF